MPLRSLRCPGHGDTLMSHVLGFTRQSLTKSKLKTEHVDDNTKVK